MWTTIGTYFTRSSISGGTLETDQRVVFTPKSGVTVPADLVISYGRMGTEYNHYFAWKITGGDTNAAARSIWRYRLPQTLSGITVTATPSKFSASISVDKSNFHSGSCDVKLKYKKEGDANYTDANGGNPISSFPYELSVLEPSAKYYVTANAYYPNYASSTDNTSAETNFTTTAASISVTANNLTWNSASITIDRSQFDATAPIKLLYKKTADAEFAYANSGNPVDTSSPFVLTGLDYSTQYDIKAEGAYPSFAASPKQLVYSSVTQFTTAAPSITVTTNGEKKTSVDVSVDLSNFYPSSQVKLKYRVKDTGEYVYANSGNPISSFPYKLSGLTQSTTYQIIAEAAYPSFTSATAQVSSSATEFSTTSGASSAVCDFQLISGSSTVYLCMESSPVGNVTLTLSTDESGLEIRTGTWTNSLNYYTVNGTGASTYFNNPVVSSDKSTVTLTPKSAIPSNATIRFNGTLEWKTSKNAGASTSVDKTIINGAYCCKAGQLLRADVSAVDNNSVSISSKNDCIEEDGYVYRLKYRVYGSSGQYTVKNDYPGYGSYQINSLLSDTKYEIICEAAYPSFDAPTSTETVNLTATTNPSSTSETCSMKFAASAENYINVKLETDNNGNLQFTMLTENSTFRSNEGMKPSSDSNMNSVYKVYVGNTQQESMSSYFNLPSQTTGVTSFSFTKKKDLPANAEIRFNGIVTYTKNGGGQTATNQSFTHTYGSYCCTALNSIVASAATPVQNKVQISFTNACIAGEAYVYRVAYWVKSTPGVVKYKNFTASSTSVNLVGLQGETTYEAKVQAAYPDFNAPAKTLNSNIVEFTTGVAPASVIVTCE